MNERFADLLSRLSASHERLMSMQPVTFATLVRANVPARGIYLFSEADEHLYVGRTNEICQRVGDHCRPGSRFGQATWAVQLARKATGKARTYRKAGGLRELVNDPAFIQAFNAQKERIRKMQVRYVEEADPLRQALLEMYVHVALNTPYNDFDNH